MPMPKFNNTTWSNDPIPVYNDPIPERDPMLCCCCCTIIYISWWLYVGVWQLNYSWCQRCWNAIGTQLDVNQRVVMWCNISKIESDILLAANAEMWYSVEKISEGLNKLNSTCTSSCLSLVTFHLKPLVHVKTTESKTEIIREFFYWSINCAAVC